MSGLVFTVYLLITPCNSKELTASKDAAMTLVADVGKAVKSEAAKGAAGTSSLIFVTSAWGWMSEELRGASWLCYALPRRGFWFSFFPLM